MLREGALIGAIGIWRDDVRAFTAEADRAGRRPSPTRRSSPSRTCASSGSCERGPTSWPARSQELQALGEVGQAVNSTLDLETVLTHHRRPRRRAVGHRRRRDLRVRRGGGRSSCSAPTHGMSDGADRARSARRAIRAGETPWAGPPATRRARADPGHRCEEPPYPLRDVARAARASGRSWPCRCSARSGSSGALVVRRRHARRVPGGDGRPAPDLRRAVVARDRERAAVPGDRGEEPPARGREPAQVAVPRQHEPRAAHAAERHPRLHRADPRQHLRRGAREDPRGARADRQERPAPARPHQRRARSLQDRGRPARRSRSPTTRMQDVVQTVVYRRRVAGRREEARAEGRRRPRPAARPRRRAAPHPGAAEPGRQRDQVHRGGRGAGRGDGRRRRASSSR